MNDLNVLWLAMGFALGLAAGYVIVRWRKAEAVRRFRAVVEYRVYLPKEELPTQDALLNRCMRECPYRVGSKPALGPPEGLLFSDVRLHFGLVLRRRNAHVFRKDVFEPPVEPHPEAFARLADATSFATIRYLSDDRLRDARHVHLLAHLADAMAALGGGLVIHDVVQEVLWLPEELAASLRENGDASRPDLNVRVVWEPQPQGGRARTLGLRKLGLPELETGPQNTDERMLVTSVLEEAAHALWNEQLQSYRDTPRSEPAPAAAVPFELQIRRFDDTFKILLAKPERGTSAVRILRVHPA